MERSGAWVSRAQALEPWVVRAGRAAHGGHRLRGGGGGATRHQADGDLGGGARRACFSPERPRAEQSVRARPSSDAAIQEAQDQGRRQLGTRTSLRQHRLRARPLDRTLGLRGLQQDGADLVAARGCVHVFAARRARKHHRAGQHCVRQR